MVASPGVVVKSVYGMWLCLGGVPVNAALGRVGSVN